jgi:outer membrane receptor for ferrienterochelin and colicin
MRVHAVVFAGLVWLAAGACASATQGGARASGGSNVITRAELDRVPGTNVYDAIQQLRPGWLSRPTAPSVIGTNPVMAYVDRHRFGAADELRNLSTSEVERIELVSAADATTRYGTGHPSGVIEITTKGH